MTSEGHFHYTAKPDRPIIGANITKLKNAASITVACNHAVLQYPRAWPMHNFKDLVFKSNQNVYRIAITGVIIKSTKAKSICGLLVTAKYLEMIAGTSISLVCGINQQES